MTGLPAKTDIIIFNLTTGVKHIYIYNYYKYAVQRRIILAGVTILIFSNPTLYHVTVSRSMYARLPRAGMHTLCTLCPRTRLVMPL